MYQRALTLHNLMRQIKVEHIGEDYSKISVNGKEFECPRGLGLALLAHTDPFEDFPIEALRKLLDYTFHDEETDYESHEDDGEIQDAHIFPHIKALSVWEHKNRKGR